MKRITLTIAAAAVCAWALRAQSFNPQVEVTNDYRTQVADVQKEEVKMDVPDSLLSFNYNLDYTVFDHPYKGSYEFKPYLIEMAPDKRTSESRRVYLSAGAGYTFSPELDLVFTPRSGGAVSGSFYDSFRGYFGPVRALESEKTFNSSLYRNTLGVQGQVAARSTTIDGTLAYDRYYAKDDVLSNALDRVSLGGSFAEIELSKGLQLSGKASLGFGSLSGAAAGTSNLGEFDLGLGVGVSSPLGRGRVAVDAGLDAAFFGGSHKATGINVYAVPKYMIESDIASLSAGVRLSFLPGSTTGKDDFAHRSAIFFPDVHGHVFIWQDKVRLFADVTGGDRLTGLADIMQMSPFVMSLPFNGDDVAALDACSERFNAVAGIGGSIARCFQYKVWGGYASVENFLTDNYFQFSPAVLPQSSLIWQDYKYAQAGVDLDYESSAFEASAALDYKHVTGLEDGFGLSPLRLDVKARYNWSRRVFAGVYCQYNAAREHAAAGVELPSYTDLGVFGEYVLRHNLSLWLRADNLLCQDLWQYTAHARTGINLTAGICLNIR